MDPAGTKPTGVTPAETALDQGATLDLIDTAIIHLDDASHVLQMNAAAEQSLQLSRDRAHGQQLSSLVPVPEELGLALEQLPLDGSGIRLHEVVLPGGQYDCTIRRHAPGSIMLELHDLEWEHKRFRLQQREMQTGLLELLSRNLGHEIRNPLGGIRGAAQMLADELSAPELVTLARLIMREADRIDELIQSFGQPKLAQLPVDIYPLVDEVLDLLTAEFGDVGVERDFDPSIPAIPGDAAAVRQVLLNLLRNAVQAHANRVVVRTRVEHGGALLQDRVSGLLRLDVIDNGEGVPESLRNLLFLPMVTGKRNGTGLGLALSQQIAAAHGGLLTYEPVKPEQGGGSCFSLYLPLQAPTRDENAEAG